MTVPVPAHLVFEDQGDGVTTEFSYPVRFLAAADLIVSLIEDSVETLQTLGTDYTVSAGPWPTGGAIVFASAPAATQTVRRYRWTSSLQNVDLQDKTRNPVEAVELQLDRLAMVGQDLGRGVAAATAGMADLDNAVARAENAKDAAESAETAAGIYALAANEAADRAEGILENAVKYDDTATDDMQFVGTGSDLSQDGGKLAKREDVKGYTDDLSAPAYLAKINGSLEFFGGKADGVFQNDDVVNDMFGALNEGDRHAIEFPPGVTLVSDVFTPIVLTGAAATSPSHIGAADRLTIQGRPHGSMFQFEAGAGDACMLFDLGVVSPNNYVQNIGISGLVIDYQNTPNTSDAFLRANQLGTLDFQDIEFFGAHRMLDFDTASRSSVKNVRCAPGADAGQIDNFIRLRNVSTIIFDDVLISSGLIPGNTNPDGKFFQFEVGATGSIDSIWLNKSHCQLYSVDPSGGSAPDGRPYGIYILKPDSGGGQYQGSVTNLWVSECVFDHTTVAAFYSEATSTNNSFSRPWFIGRNRFATDAGRGVHIKNTGGRLQTALSIDDNYIVARGAEPAVEVESGSKTVATRVTRNTILDRKGEGGRVSKTSAIKMGGSNFFVSENLIDNDENEVPTFESAIEIADATSTNFVIGVNYAPNVRNYIKEPSYSSVPGRRSVYRPQPSNAAGVDMAELYDDFCGNALRDDWLSVVGSDGAIVPMAITPANPFGLASMSTGTDAGGTMALNGVELVSDLNWRAGYGSLKFESRFRLTSVSSVVVFAGFTDTTSLEMPFTLSGSTLTSNASNACGILFDSAASVANYHLVGVKADVDATIQNSGVAASTNDVLVAIELDVSGNASFSINRSPIGTIMADAVTPSTSLTPCLAIFSRGTGQRTLRADFIRVSGRRNG